MGEQLSDDLPGGYSSGSSCTSSEDSVYLSFVNNEFECVSSGVVQQKDAPTDLDTTDDREDAELLVPIDSLPHKRRRVFAVRDFPCPQKNFKASSFEVRDSSLCDESEYEDLFSSPENRPESIKSAEEATPNALDGVEDKELSEEAELELSGSNSIISMYNISLNSYGFPFEEDDEELEGIDKPNKVIDSKGLNIEQSETSEEATSFKTKGLNTELSDAEEPIIEAVNDSENLSGQCSKRISEKGPSSGENQVPKGTIVLALMAAGAPDCPWDQPKRASTRHTTRSRTRRSTNKSRKRKR